MFYTNILASIISLFIILYGSLMKPKLPLFLESFLKNNIVRVVYLFLMTYIAEKNLLISVSISFLYIFLFNLIEESDLKEKFSNIDINEKKVEELLENLDEE